MTLAEDLPSDVGELGNISWLWLSGAVETIPWSSFVGVVEGARVNRIVAITSRFVSAEPVGADDDPAYSAPPVGRAFAGFAATMVLLFILAIVEASADLDIIDDTGQYGMVATTVFLIAGVAAGYRAVTTRSLTLAPIVALLLGPGALWCWLVVVRGTATGVVATVLVLLTAVVVGSLLLIEGLWRARWLGVFCGLGAVGIAMATNLIRSNPDTSSTVSFVLLLTTAGMACLYGTLVEIESTGHHSFEQLLDAKRKIQAEIAQTEDMLHDLRTGLLAIEAAMVSLDDDVGGPLRSETARLRQLTARGKRRPHEFDMVPGIRDMVKARRSAGVTIDLRAPTSAQILGEESEVLAIVDNLLSNAMRHGADPVEVAIEENAGHVQVRVTDSGKVRDPSQSSGFFRRGFTSHRDGDGIGLDRARMLAELHNGTVVYEPDDNGKTSFVLTLPNSEIARESAEPKVVMWSPVGR